MTLSTASAPRYWETTFLPVVSLPDGGVPDILSDRIVDLLDSITISTPYTIREGDKITTICFEFYQTTSLYYLLLYYNGLLFWDELQPGDVIQIPNLEQINDFFGRNRQQIGQRISV